MHEKFEEEILGLLLPFILWKNMNAYASKRALLFLFSIVC